MRNNGNALNAEQFRNDSLHFILWQNSAIRILTVPLCYVGIVVDEIWLQAKVLSF